MAARLQADGGAQGIAAIVHIFRGKFNVLFAGTVQHDFTCTLALRLARRIYVRTYSVPPATEAFESSKIATIPTTNRAACQRQVGIHCGSRGRIESIAERRRPSQVGQAPAGMNEQTRFSSYSAYWQPQIGRAKLAENRSSSAFSSSISATTAVPPDNSAPFRTTPRALGRSLRTLGDRLPPQWYVFLCNLSFGRIGEGSRASPSTHGRECNHGARFSSVLVCLPLRSLIIGASSIQTFAFRL